MDKKETPALRLRIFRARAGLSQAELAKKAGYTPQTISYYETGKRRITRDAADALAKHLQISPDYLLCLTDFKNWLEYYNHVSREKINVFLSKRKLLENIGITIKPYCLDFSHDKYDEEGFRLNEDEYAFDEDGSKEYYINGHYEKAELTISDGEIIEKTYNKDGECTSESPIKSWEDVADLISCFSVKKEEGELFIVPAKEIFALFEDIENYIKMYCDSLLKRNLTEKVWENRKCF